MQLGCKLNATAVPCDWVLAITASTFLKSVQSYFINSVITLRRTKAIIDPAVYAFGHFRLDLAYMHADLQCNRIAVQSGLIFQSKYGIAL